MTSPSELIDRYHLPDSKWYEKALVISIYHTLMCGNNPHWTLRMTAKAFDRSVGLISEDIRLARLLSDDPNMLKLPDRQTAVKRLKA